MMRGGYCTMNTQQLFNFDFNVMLQLHEYNSCNMQLFRECAHLLVWLVKILEAALSLETLVQVGRLQEPSPNIIMYVIVNVDDQN